MPPPDRWDAYCPLGKVIPGTKFIAFKVPLKEALLTTVQEDDKFSPSLLMSRLEEQGLSLAAVIDLTFTWKYYDKDEFLSRGVDHKKVFTKGHEVPSDSVYREFVDNVNSFQEKEHLIGVHCTHGVNRTGYLICRYMIEILDLDPQDAINKFNSARGHGIERENYIQDLKCRTRGRSTWGLIARSDSDEGGVGKRRKPRWRHHKEDHPYWRQGRMNGQTSEAYPEQGRTSFHFPDPSSFCSMERGHPQPQCEGFSWRIDRTRGPVTHWRDSQQERDRYRNLWYNLHHPWRQDHSSRDAYRYGRDRIREEHDWGQRVIHRTQHRFNTRDRSRSSEVSTRHSHSRSCDFRGNNN